MLYSGPYTACVPCFALIKKKALIPVSPISYVVNIIGIHGHGRFEPRSAPQILPEMS